MLNLHDLPGHQFDDVVWWLEANFGIADAVGVDFDADPLNGDLPLIVIWPGLSPDSESSAFPLGPLELPRALADLQAIERAGGIANMEPPELQPTA